jgi:HTH-type transcriptional regulator/antitoxin HigA
MTTGIHHHAFDPDYVSPPGATLRDRIAELSVTQADLAARTGLSTKHVNQIMQGLAPITPETALALERVTSIPAGYWNRREADYRSTLLKLEPPTLTEDDERWLASLPIKELQARKRLPNETDRGRLFEAVLSFFGVAHREAHERIWRKSVASFRRSDAYRSAPGSVVSWLRIGELESQGIETKPFSPTRFRRALAEIRALTAAGDPNQMVHLCAEAGVVVVFVPEVKGCRISGATWWASPGRPVIALSDRYKKDDFFWFTFFHEAAHILLHSKKDTFVDDGTDDDLVEEEANRFAEDILIPRDQKRRLHTLTTESDAVLFAEQLGIAPGIVVGRLQHEGLWPWSKGQRLKRSIQIVEG